MDAGLRDRVVLITGGGGGLGPTLARTFAAEGAAIAVQYRSSRQRAESVADEIRAAGGRAVAVGAGLAEAVAAGAMVAEVERALGPVAVLVTATSTFRMASLEETSDEAWGADLDGMLGAAFRASRAVVPGMRAAGFGRIVHVAARSGLVGAGRAAAYVAAKAGIVGLTLALAKELGPAGILVNAVAPTTILTERDGVLSVSADRQASLARSIPLGRLATPDDVARAVLWLGSAHNSFVTGEVLGITGGAGS